MKKILFIVCMFVTILTSCAPSNEERAKKMASNYLKGVLCHFDSYEPITTTVDSLFVSVSTDEEAISLTVDLMKLFLSVSECAEKMREAQQAMNLWCPMPYSSSYSKGEYEQAKQEKEHQEHLLEKYRERVKTQFTKIKSRQSYLEAEASSKNGDFTGWRVYHKFKSLNVLGNLNIFGEYIFLCDKEFQNCKGYEKEEFDAISKVLKAISESNEISELQDNLLDMTY